jgi:hypothetical protein
MAKTLLEMLRMPNAGGGALKPLSAPRLVKKPVARGAAWPAANLGKFLTPKGGR